MVVGFASRKAFASKTAYWSDCYPAISRKPRSYMMSVACHFTLVLSLLTMCPK